MRITVIFEWILFILTNYDPSALALEDLSTKGNVFLVAFGRVYKQNAINGYSFVADELVCSHNELLSFLDFDFIVFGGQRAVVLRPVEDVEPVAPAQFVVADQTGVAHRFACISPAVLTRDFDRAVVLEAVADQPQLQVRVKRVLPPEP